MKTKITLLCLLAFLSIFPKAAAQCTTGTQKPTDTYQATSNAAGTSVINTDAKLGEYARVHVIPDKRYSFSTSVSTDYITITNDNGMVLASGVTPLYYISNYNEAIRYYIHQNAQCQTANLFNRTRYISWEVAPPCNDPTIVGISNIAPNSCTVNLIEPDVVPYFGYEVHVNTSPTTPLAQVQTSDSTTNTVFVSGLNPDTTYYYWVRSDCMFQKGDWIYGGSFDTISSLVCNSAYYGLYPAATFTPTCTGNDELFSNASKNGSYSNIAVVANTEYTFKSNNGSDFVTITNASGTTVFTNGQTPITWNSGSNSGVVRFYVHGNAQCNNDGNIRSKYVKCVTTSVSCLPPTNLAVSNITSNSIRLGWTAPAAAPSSGYQIYMITTNTAPGVTTNPTSTSTTAGVDYLSGLTAGVTYYYWIRSNCGTEKSTWASGGSFTVNASLTCNGAIYGLYPNNTFTPSCTGSAETIVSTALAGQYSNVTVAANQQYTFSSSVGTDFITITNAAGTLVLASGLTPLSWASGTNSGVVRYHLNSNGNCGSQNVNRTKYMQCAASAGSCGVPSALSVSNITSNSCRLNWTAPAAAPSSGYEIYLVTTNTAPVASSTTALTSTTAGVGVLNGLTAATTYYYWIRSNCGTAKSTWVSGGTFTTNATLTCNGALNGLYPETTFTPACSGSVEQITTQSWAGEYSNVNVLANKQYTFTSSVSTDFLTVTNAAGTAVLASGVTPLIWSSGSTTGLIRYHLNTNANCGTQNTDRVRSIKCVDAPATSCGVPSTLSVSNITSNSSRLNWAAPATAPSSGYEIFINTTNTAPVVSSTNVLTSTTNGIGVLTSLTASTTYYYWIRSNCGSDKSAWVSGGSFTTIANIGCNGAENGLYPNATFTPICSGSFEQITPNAYAGEYSNVNVTTNKQYTFNSSITTDYVTITNATGTAVLASGLVPLTWASGSTSGIIRYHLTVNANCGAQNTDRVKSIKCADATPTCGTPLEVNVSNVTSNSAQINWAAPSPAPASGYDVYVVSNGSTPIATTTPTQTSIYTFALVTGLVSGNNYNYWVRSNCGSTKGTWVHGGSFDPLPALACNGALYGNFPGNVFTSNCAGVTDVITYEGRGGDYSEVFVFENHTYVFSSSVATDYITITDNYGTTVYASGTTPVTWSTPNLGGIVRFYLHTNANCGTSSTIRAKSVKCSDSLGFEENTIQNMVKIYPNPSAGQFTIETGSITADTIVIMDNLGRIVNTIKPSLTKSVVSLGGFAEGIYYVKIAYQDKNVMKKLVLKKN